MCHPLAQHTRTAAYTEPHPLNVGGLWASGRPAVFAASVTSEAGHWHPHPQSSAHPGGGWAEKYSEADAVEHTEDLGCPALSPGNPPRLLMSPAESPLKSSLRPRIGVSLGHALPREGGAGAAGHIGGGGGYGGRLGGFEFPSFPGTFELITSLFGPMTV